jgi:hypothetical protein
MNEAVIAKGNDALVSLSNLKIPLKGEVSDNLGI